MNHPATIGGMSAPTPPAPPPPTPAPAEAPPPFQWPPLTARRQVRDRRVGLMLGALAALAMLGACGADPSTSTPDADVGFPCDAGEQSCNGRCYPALHRDHCGACGARCMVSSCINGPTGPRCGP